MFDPLWRRLALMAALLVALPVPLARANEGPARPGLQTACAAAPADPRALPLVSASPPPAPAPHRQPRAWRLGVGIATGALLAGVAGAAVGISARGTQ